MIVRIAESIYTNRIYKINQGKMRLPLIAYR